MLDRIKKLFGMNYTEKEINKLKLVVREINQYFQEYEKLSDEQIKAKTEEFKKRVQEKGESLDSILPEAFAVVKQAAKRMCGQTVNVKGEKVLRNMIPYDVQLVGGIVLHQGKIAEMKTGEGKTLVATLPVYLNALEGKGVYVVTVNDYLASRDTEWMGHLYQRLGLSVGCVVKGVAIQDRRGEYEKDITYVENSELGFDYLRDNLVKSINQRVLTRRPLNYAIIDEIDSILIDEARTPLIISEAREEATEKYQYYAKIVQTLTPCSGKKRVSKGLLYELMNEDAKKESVEDGDYYIDEKTKTVSLSGEGIQKLEKMLGVENLYKDIGYEEIHHIENALRAKAVYERDKEYIVKGGEVLIVDEHTGRTMPGRRFSEGLHQAIEAKEMVEIKRESQTMATITYQNFFKQFGKLSGMTGTAVTEGEEFSKIYNLDVLEIPTNKETIRVDRHDKVYFNQNAKRKFVKEDIKFYHEMGQPMLIGTANIATSEYLSKILEKEGINHYVLNAKFFEQEAHIVSNGGKFKSVVVATNMAGRGTDIKLEKGLNEKLANNYVKRAEKNVKNWDIEYNIYSSKELELTLEAIKQIFGIDDEAIRQMGNGGIEIKQTKISTKFNTSRKRKTEVFAKIYFTLVGGPSLPNITKDLQYGLFVLGTEKHESRRIDNQLRGRSGRQGDPGKSVFYVALDDLIMRKMGGEKIMGIASMLMKKEELENLELTQKQFTSAIERAQKQIEAWHFSIRKHLFDYDSVIDKQRQRIYKKRDEILASELDEELKKEFVKNTKKDLRDNIDLIINVKINEAKNLKQTNIEFLETLIKEFNIKLDKKTADKWEAMGFNDLELETIETLGKYLEEKLKKLDDDKLYDIFRDVLLHHLDKLWVDHIDEMQYLRDKVGFMGYAQQDPLIVYKKESFEKFQSLIYTFKSTTTSYILNLDFDAIQKQDEIAKLILEKQKSGDKEFLSKLSKVSGNLQELIKLAKQEEVKRAENIKREMIFEDEDGFEVFEVGDEKGETKNDSGKPIENTKIRPNDKVTVKYKDGKMEYSIKYKKVKDDVLAGKCEVIKINEN
ncbi:MAG TPA: preprotein translocase subunit SecA [Candidatus Absconditabacterales bacterium]|nr:preprotein translocase subunit SecA [Candidatus Absconditabacterales bacterium]HOQ78681.1 preprotein translocase subunit SecA [Candidatus Absconditabacterales bacterium]HPK27996.1 preprotein translocase subunit SecA [Candidatus Absconditabacterales bacterium]